MSLGENRRVSAYGFQPKTPNGDGFLPGTKPEQHSCSYCKLTTSQNHHFPSAPLAIITTSLPHHFPSSPLPFCHLFPKSRHWNKLKWRINSTNFLLALGSRPILTNKNGFRSEASITKQMWWSGTAHWRQQVRQTTHKKEKENYSSGGKVTTLPSSLNEAVP